MKKLLGFLICIPFIVLTAQAGTITVTAPNGGETWTIGSSRTNTRSSSGVDGEVNIILMRRTMRVVLIKSGVSVAAGASAFILSGY
jgi:hypothetical protein